MTVSQAEITEDAGTARGKKRSSAGAGTKSGKGKGRPTKKATLKLHRLTLNVSMVILQKMDVLMEITGASGRAEVFRNAVKIYEIAVEAQGEGKRLYLEDPERPERRTYISV